MKVFCYNNSNNIHLYKYKQQVNHRLIDGLPFNNFGVVSVFFQLLIFPVSISNKHTGKGSHGHICPTLNGLTVEIS